MSSQSASTSLRVEAQQLAGFFLGLKAIVHNVEPDTTSRTVLRNFLKEVVVRIPEERQARGKIVDIKSGCNGCIDIRDAIGNGESDFLNRRRTSFTDVIARN